MALEPRIEAVRATYGLSTDDFWQIKQNKQWVCKHAALEIVAVKAGIEWFPPQIIEADAPNLVTSMIVTGKMGDRTEWATGETNKTNYSVQGKQPAYPWAMTEKRAKDRVVLKLVGIHGLVYSEDEAEDFKGTKPQETSSESAYREKHAAAIDSLWAEITAISSTRGLELFWKDNVKTINAFDEVNKDRFIAKKDELKSKFSRPSDTVSDIQDTFPGSQVVAETVREQHVLEAGE
jgi:hypothetical protein